MNIAIPYPNGGYARIIAQPNTGSDPSLTDDEKLLLAQHLKIEYLQKEIAAAQVLSRTLIYAVGEWLNGHTNESHDRLYEIWVENKQGDDIALKNMLTAERERCIAAIVASSYNDTPMSAQECVDTIRALGNE